MPEDQRYSSIYRSLLVASSRSTYCVSWTHLFSPEDSKVKAEIDKYKLAAEENKDSGSSQTKEVPEFFRKVL